MQLSDVEVTIQEFCDEFGPSEVVVLCRSGSLRGFDFPHGEGRFVSASTLPEPLNGHELHDFEVRVFGGIKSEFCATDVASFFSQLSSPCESPRVILIPFFSPWETKAAVPLVCRESIRERSFRIRHDDLCKVRGKAGFAFSEMQRRDNRELILALQEHMRAGDCYLANATCRIFDGIETLLFSPLNFFRLWSADPSRFGAFFSTSGDSLMSFSPERFLCSRGGWLQTEPIKGTLLGKGARPSCEEAHTLWSSEKEVCEHIMVVDLLRNDLNTVCIPGSVEVFRPFYAGIAGRLLQMQSFIFGKRRPDLRTSDVLRMVLPAGSVTGTPKWRVCELIKQYEADERGWYTGILGVEEPSGDFDMSLLIRTHFLREGRAVFGVGAGITTLSDADQEVDEFEIKARSFLSRLSP
jgi:anthranilate/para-aminobenzoate synthase component I